MFLELKLQKIEDSVGVILPQEVLARLQVGDSDTVLLTDAPDGGVRLTPGNNELLASQMRAADGIICRYHETLTELAN